MVQSIADFASLKQVAGDEQQPRQLARVAAAAVKGTMFEKALTTPGQLQYFLEAGARNLFHQHCLPRGG